MGRGGADELEILGSGSLTIPVALAARTTRGLNRKLFTDRSEWIEREKQFITGVRDELNDAVRRFASSDESWRDYLRIYAQTPDYSAFNNLWARLQLQFKGTDPRGIILSESQWAKLGRRVKAEYAMPSRSPRSSAGRRDKRFGYDSERDWDDSYCVELMRPLGGGKLTKQLKDKDGNPILDENGKPKTEIIYRRSQGFGVFKAYHEAATEALDGGAAKPLPASPWASATGSEADAERLLNDLNERVAGVFGLKITEREPTQIRDLSNASRIASATDGRHIARLTGDQIELDPEAPITERATAVLHCLAEAASTEFEPRDDDERARQRAAIASTTYAIASLYGLESGAESFPELAQIAEQDGGLRRLDSEIHARTSRILSLIDPRLREKALKAQEQDHTGSRAAERARQAEAKRGEAKSATEAILN